MKNLTLQSWRSARPSLGGWISLDNVHSAEAMANLGFDWLCIDLQHGLLDYSDLTRILPAIATTDTTPIVRVAWNRPEQIMKALDAGAQGVIVPMVNSAEDARRAAAACRYPPAGERSFGPIRAALSEGADYLASANTEIACIVMIETHDALERVEDIARVEGVDALFVGPADLALSLGISLSDAPNEPRFQAALGKVLSAARKNDRFAGIFGYSLESVRSALAAGFTFASIGTDIGFMTSAAANALSELRPGRPAESSERHGY